MQTHAVLTLFGLVLAALAVWWVEPNTAGGTGFIVVVMVLLANAIGALAARLLRPRSARPKRAKKTGR